MKDTSIPNEITTRLVSDLLIKAALKSIIWFGSVRNRQDVHPKSDCDLQIILDRPSPSLSLHISTVLQDYPEVDLSIMYMQDIRNHNGDIIFHDGTKSLFFMYVLADGEILYGENIYSDITNRLSLDDILPSLLTTIREYLSRLRIMAIQSPDDTLAFKKYSLKLFKDILVYKGKKKPIEITRITNNMARNEIQKIHDFQNESKKALYLITDYSHVFSNREMAHLLYDYEYLVERLCNE
jgi:predicted nucleotidyltransferase